MRSVFGDIQTLLAEDSGISFSPLYSTYVITVVVVSCPLLPAVRAYMTQLGNTAVIFAKIDQIIGRSFGNWLQK